MSQKYDFSGWATKYNIKCSDGRTIMPNAFSHADGTRVPLVWNHNHENEFRVLGYAELYHRDAGEYAYCSFNESDSGKMGKELVRHGDVVALSIFANKLQQTPSKEVIHGEIKEVSLVLAGANPGAFIDNVLCHSEKVEDAAYIYNDADGIELYHADEEKDKEEIKMENETKDKTVQDVVDSMDEDQKKALYILVAAALEKASEVNENKQDNTEGGKNMAHNVFENDTKENTLTHSEEMTIINDIKRYGSMKESFLAHAQEYGIENIDYLFPEAKTVNATPALIGLNPTGWVQKVMNGVHHTPFSRIKSVFADITEDEARAKGYVKGNLKTDEVISLLRRTTNPTTVYKKQRLDRNDILDITSMDAVAFLKGEMRGKLDEELARAYLFGDNRSAASADKIDEQCIRPIVKDADLFVITKEIPQDLTDDALLDAIITAIVLGQDEYRGSGNLTYFAPTSLVSAMLLMKDTMGHRLYKDIKELAMALNVNEIVKVPTAIVPTGCYGTVVDLDDYNVGADKGGAINMFEDFDIDYNQEKYLIETRCSAALTLPKSAIVIKAED